MSDEVQAYEVEFEKPNIKRIVIAASSIEEAQRIATVEQNKLYGLARPAEKLPTNVNVRSTDKDIPPGLGMWPPDNVENNLWVTLEDLEDVLREHALWTHKYPPYCIYVDHGDRPHYLRVVPFHLRGQGQRWREHPFEKSDTSRRRVFVAERKTTAWRLGDNLTWEEKDPVTQEMDRIVRAIYEVEDTWNGPPERTTWSWLVTGLKDGDGS